MRLMFIVTTVPKRRRRQNRHLLRQIHRRLHQNRPDRILHEDRRGRAGHKSLSNGLFVFRSGATSEGDLVAFAYGDFAYTPNLLATIGATASTTSPM